MRASTQLIAAAAVFGIAGASPAPQAIALGAVFTAAPATISGPPLSAITQTAVVNTQALVASITAQVTTVATAAITGQAAANAANISPPSKRSLRKRNVEKRDLLSNILSMLGARFGTTSKAAAAPTTSSSTPVVVATTAAASTTPATTAATTAPATTAANIALNVATTVNTASATGGGLGGLGIPPPAILAATSSSTSTPLSVSGTSTSSATTACPTTPENGTYCGFINPEDPCAPQPAGSGPTITPDTVAAFMSYAPFQSMAANAVSPSTYVNTFKNYNASSSATSYIGLYTLLSYDPAACAAYCDSTTSCTAFNLYIERDPSLNPCQNDSTAPTVWGYWCPNPSSITNYKCTLWGSNLDGTTATNTGGWRGAFQVAITGSNGYDKTNVTTPISITSYTPPQNCSGKATNSQNYWLGSKFFNGPYDPTLCSAYANATTSCNKQAAIAAGKSTYTPCQMFNAYHLYKSGAPLGTYCSLFNAQLSTSWASTTGSYSGNDFYAVRNSWQYQLATPDSGRCSR